MLLSDKKNHLQCKRVFVNSDLRTLSRSPSPFNMFVPLSDEVKNIVGLEVSSWNVNFDTAPCIFKAGNSVPKQAQNNLLDIRVTRLDTSETSTATVELQPAGYKNATDLVKSLVDQMGHAFNTYGAVFTGTVGADGKAVISCTSLSVGDLSLEYLFASGPSAGKTSYRLLGFASPVDTPLSLVSPVVHSPVAQYPPFLKPYRSVDVSVAEASEFPILRRIDLSGDGYYSSDRVYRGFALLTRPLRTIHELRVVMRLSDGSGPTRSVSGGYDLVLDALTLVEAESIPPWVHQVIRL